jgi:hypothetical protein
MPQSIEEKITTRFTELDKLFSVIPMLRNESGHGYHSDGAWRQWATSAQHLIVSTFGKGSIHTENFSNLYARCVGYDDELSGLLAIFRSAMDDHKSGFAANFELSVSGEIFGDFVKLAKQTLSEGHKDVAAVLASAALEDALKRFATASGIDTENQDMQGTINALKAKGFVSGAQKTLLDVMPRIRNFALHADWEKLTEPEVNSLIGFVEQFLLTRF